MYVERHKKIDELKKNHICREFPQTEDEKLEKNNNNEQNKKKHS